MKKLLERIREICAERGMSLSALEAEAGIVKNTICRWGDNTPSVDKVAKVAAALGVTVDDLLREDEAGETENGQRAG